MGKLNIALFQHFQAHIGEITVTGFKSDKARALLAFLAIESGVPHARSSLAVLLWPDLSEQTAHSNLRSVLANLRSIIEKKNGLNTPVILADYQTICLKQNAFVCDVNIFERHLANGQLKEAMSAYRGRLLMEFYSGSSLFDDWQQMRADALNQKAMQALNTLIRDSLQVGNLNQALQYSQQQLSLDPVNEDSHQIMIYLLALNGQISAALSQMAICRQMLTRELWVQPSAETLALEQAILKRHNLPLPHLLKKDEPISLQLRSPQPLVSRENELDCLNEHLSSALNGHGKVFFVCGDTGSGKTRLIEAFTAQSAKNHPQLITLRSTCVMHGELAGPFYPFREIFLQLTHTPEKRDRLDLGDPQATRPLDQLNQFVVKSLNEVAPDLDTLLKLGKTTFPVDPALNGKDGFTLSLQRGSLYQQSIDLLERLASKYPLLITFDDLQWMDADSLNLFHFLGTRLQDMQVLIIGTYRCEEVSSGTNGQIHLLENYLQEFKRLYGNSGLDLNQSDGRSFIDEYLDTFPNRLSKAFRETLFQHTGGHALFTVELVESLKRSGRLNLDEQRLWVDNPKIAWDKLPARVEAIITQRIKRLPAFWQHALAVASVEGEYFTGEVLAAVLDSQPSMIIQGLSRVAGRQHGLVNLEDIRMVNGKRLSIFHFQHSFYQRFLYQRLDAAEHSILHEEVGNALESFYQGSSELNLISFQLAYHFEKAGQKQKAAGYYFQTGHTAIQASSFLEAEKQLNHAYSLLQPNLQGVEENRLAIDILNDLSLVDLALYGWGSEERGKVLTSASLLVTHTGTVSEQLLINTRIIGNLLGSGQWHDAIQKSQEILTVPGEVEKDVLYMQACMMRGISFIFLGRLAEGLNLLEEVFAYTQNHHEDPFFVDIKTDEQIARVAYTIGLVLVGRPVQAQIQLDFILEKARQEPSPLILGLGLTIGGFTKSVLTEDFQASIPYAHELLDKQPLREFQAFLPWIEFMDGWLDFQNGQQRSGLRKLKNWGERCKTKDWFLGLPFLLCTLADSMRMVSQAAEGERIIEYVIKSIENGTGSYVMLSEFLCQRGECQLAQGNIEKAEASFREALNVAQKLGAFLFQIKAANNLCRLKLDGGSANGEVKLLSQIYSSFTEGWDSALLRTARDLIREGGGAY